MFLAQLLHKMFLTNLSVVELLKTQNGPFVLPVPIRN